MILLEKQPHSFDEMAAEMLKCEQTEGQSVFQHGQAVAETINLLISSLKANTRPPEGHWRLPDWFYDYRVQILKSMHPEEIVQLYAMYHDCGKPFCIEYDLTGKRRFPNHAEISKKIWNSVGGNELVGKLIGEDMVIHTCTASDIAVKLSSEWSCQDSITLLIASLAEIHANASMFGGIESTSFKIKYKKVEQRGLQICKHWFLKDQSGS
jgi:hypothetical protein